MKYLEILLFASTVAIFVFYVLLQAFYCLLLIASFYGAWAQSRLKKLYLPQQLVQSPVTPPISILVPAHNEEATIRESVQALLGLNYPRFEVIVINDGSTDGTLAELIQSFSLRRAEIVYHPLLPTQPIHSIYVSLLEPRLTVIDKVGGGKSDALNAGINLSNSPWVCSLDADSILEEDALLRGIRPAIEDARVAATCGIVRVANGCRVAAGRVLRVALPRSRLVVLQVVEYLRGFLGGRLGWSWLNGLVIISGAFGIFRTDLLRTIGGYSRETVGEDMEIVFRIHRHFRQIREPYRVVFVPDPVCWTQVPSDFSTLRQQRRRWQRGLAEVLAKHRSLFFRPAMGVVGCLAFPYFVLEFLAPVMEISGFILVPVAWALGFLDWNYTLLYLVLAFLLGVLFALWAVVIEEFTYRRYTSWGDLFRLLFFALFEHLGYHQIVLWWRLEGILDYFRKKRGWGEQVRSGFRHPAPVGQPR